NEKGSQPPRSSGVESPNQSHDRSFPPLTTWLPPNHAARLRKASTHRLEPGDAIPRRSPLSRACARGAGMGLPHDLYELGGQGMGGGPGQMMHNINSGLSDSQRAGVRASRGSAVAGSGPGSGLAGPRRRLDPQLLHLAVQVRSLDAELARRVAEVAAV